MGGLTLTLGMNRRLSNGGARSLRRQFASLYMHRQASLQKKCPSLPARADKETADMERKLPALACVDSYRVPKPPVDGIKSILQRTRRLLCKNTLTFWEF